MRADHLAGWNAGVVATAALAVSLFPAAILSSLGVDAPSFPVLALARTLGAVCLVLAVVLWYARHWLGGTTGRTARRSLAAAYGLGGILLLLQQIAIWNSRAGLLVFVAFAGWGVAYLMSTEAARESSLAA